MNSNFFRAGRALSAMALGLATLLAVGCAAPTSAKNDDKDEAPVVTTLNAGWTGSVTGGIWWTVFASEADVQVPSGKTVETTMTINSVGVENWLCAPDVIVRKADMTEYAVFRADNFGWGSNYGTATLSSDWDWDAFKTWVNGSTVTIQVTNTGDGTASVHYDFVKGSETHYQYYDYLTVDASDVYINLVFEGSDLSVSFQ